MVGIKYLGFDDEKRFSGGQLVMSPMNMQIESKELCPFKQMT